jgi:hypothetical protein
MPAARLTLQVPTLAGPVPESPLALSQAHAAPRCSLSLYFAFPFSLPTPPPPSPSRISPGLLFARGSPLRGPFARSPSTPLPSEPSNRKPPYSVQPHKYPSQHWLSTHTAVLLAGLDSCADYSAFCIYRNITIFRALMVATLRSKSQHST